MYFGLKETDENVNSLSSPYQSLILELHLNFYICHEMITQLLIWKANVNAMILSEERNCLKLFFMGIRIMTGTLGYIKIIYTPQGVHNTLIFLFFFQQNSL